MGLANAELARERVASRVADGGHPVPVAKIRERFQRGLDRIREAARMAHRCEVWDNSRIEVPLVPVLTLENGEIVSLGRSLPAWVETAYSA